MSSRRSKDEKVQIIFMYAKYENISEVIRQWNTKFSSEAPSRKTISNIVQRFQETGSVEDLERTGRPLTGTSLENLESVKQTVTQSPKKSIRRGSAETGISRSSYHRSLQKLDLKAFRPQFVVELSDDDFDRRMEFCERMLALVHKDPSLLLKILWTDEADFKLNGHINRHNSSYWAEENPHEQIPIKHSPQGVMVWCGIWSEGLIGPFFFDENVNGQSYLRMLTEFLWPKIKEKHIHFQQDGAPAHYANTVRSWLDENFPEQWLGRRGPIEWPPRSPDLSPCDFFLWGHLKHIVYGSKPSTVPALRDRIQTACSQVTAEMCLNVCKSVPGRWEDCVQLSGKQLII